MTFEGQSMLDERDRAYWFSEILSLFECRDPENAHPHIVNQLLDSCDVEYQLLYEHFEQKLRNSEKSSCDALTNRSRVSETSIQGFDPIKSGSKRLSGVSVHAASRRASTAMSMAMKNPKPDVPKIPETEREMWYNRVYELMLQLKPEGATPENIDVLLDEFDGRYDDLISKLTARLPNTGLTSLPHINPEMDMLPRDANVDVVAGEPQNECLDASSREEWIARLSNFFLLHTKESSNLSSKENIAFLLDHVDGFYGNFFRFVQSEPRIAEESETMDRHDVLEAFLSSPFSYDLWHGRFRRLLQEKRPELSSDHEVAEIMVLSGEAFGQLYRKLCANYNYSPDTSKTATPHPDTLLMDPSTRLRKDPERHDPSAQPEKEEGKKERYFTSRRGSTIESTAQDKKSAKPETPSDTEMAATTTPKSDTLHGSEETKNPEDDGGKKRGSIIKQWTRRISRRLSLGNPSQSGRSRKNSEILVLTPPQTPTHGRTKENPAHSAGTRRSSQVLNEEKRDQSAHRASRTSSNDLSSGRTFGQRMVDFLKGKASDSNQGQTSDDSLPSISSVDEDDITQYEQEKDKLSQQRKRAEEDEQTREEGIRRELEMVIDLRLRDATEARRLEQALDRLPLSLQPLRIFRLLTFEQKVDRLLKYFRWRDPTMANRSSVVRFIREYHSRMCWRHFWAYACETYGPEPYSLLDLNLEIEQSEHNPSETHEEQEPYSIEASVSITLTYIGFRPEQMRALSNYQRISVQEAIINDIDMNAPPPRHPVKVSAPWITDSSLVHLKLSGAVEDLRMIVEFICDKVAEKMFSTSASRQTLRKAKIHVLKDLKVIKAEVVSHIKPTHTPSAPHQMHDSARTRHSRGSSNELIHPPPSHHLGWIDLDSDSALDTRNRTPPRVPKPNFDRNEISPSPLMVKTAVMAQSAVETPKGPLTWEQQRHSALIKQRVVPRIPTLSRAMGEPWSKPNDPRFVELQLSLRSSPRHQVYGNRTRNTHEDFIQY